MFHILKRIGIIINTNGYRNKINIILYYNTDKYQDQY